MNTSIERKKEMKWLKEVGVKGLKVDFFGGDGKTRNDAFCTKIFYLMPMILA